MYPLEVSAFDVGQRRYAQLQTLLDVGSPQRDWHELFLDLIPRLRNYVPFDAVLFATFSSSRQSTEIFFDEGVEWSTTRVEMAADDCATGFVWRNQNPLSIDDTRIEYRFAPELSWLRQRGIHSYYVFPLTTIQRRVGAIGFGSAASCAVGPEEIQLLSYAATMIALSLDSTLSEALLMEEKARLRLTLEVNDPYLKTADSEEVLSSVIESIQKWAGSDLVGIYLYDDVSQSLYLRMNDPNAARKLSPQNFSPLEETLTGQVFRSARSLILDHSSLEALPFASVKRGMESGVRSLYLAPLVSGKRTMAVLKVARRSDRAFSPRDIQLLEETATAIIPILERKQDEEEKKKKARRIKESDSMVPRRLELVAGTAEGAFNLGDISTATGNPTKVLFSAPGVLMESEQLLAAYFKASKVGLCILDTEFRYLAVNGSLAEINGVPAAAHLGKRIRDIVGDVAEVVELELSRLLLTGQPISDLEVSLTLATRTQPGHWLVHFIPIQDAKGNVAQIGGIVVEVTEKKKLEESLRGVSETLQLEKKRQHVLAELSRVLATREDIRQVFPQVSAYLRRILRQEYAALSVRDEQSGKLVRQAIDFPLRKGTGPDAEASLAEDPAGRALQERESVILGREEIQRFQSRITEQLLTEGLQALCCVPLIRPAGPLGILVLGSTRADAFKTDDLILLNQVAAQLASALENAGTAREIEQLKIQLGREKRHLAGESRTRIGFEGIVGESPALQKVLDQVEVVAKSDATVLLLGETGTGKGLIANAIHRLSYRNGNGKAFITLNCAAIPTGLLESELFGHEKGAFTGAVSHRVGRMELADKGTLFLDEIGEISRDLQPKLLRVLQDHEFERLGANRTIKVNLRLIAATNRDLAKSVAQNEFRSDLFYRLNVFPLRLPPLRERREDIPDLVRYFVRKYTIRMGRIIETVPTETMEALINWSWPGNVRELENVIERSVILTDGTSLRVPLEELIEAGPDAAENSLADADREHIIRVLRETRGILSGPNGASQRLGLKRTTLQSKMDRLGITRKDYSDSKE
jgi:formate hydrogenlyase transcriptional activator